MRKKIAALSAITLLTLAATGCSAFTEPYNDAPVDHKNDDAAVVYSMPDGFANFAEKCDEHGNLVISTRTDGGEALAVVPNDPDCK